MQRLPRLPAAPNVTLLDRGKPKPYPWSHANTTFTTQIYIRWCCFDLSNAPRLSGVRNLELLTELSVPRQSASSALVVKLRTRSEMQRDVDCTGLHVTTQLHVVEGHVGRQQRSVVLEKLGYFVEVKDGAGRERGSRGSVHLGAGGVNDHLIDAELFLLIHFERHVIFPGQLMHFSDRRRDEVYVALRLVELLKRIEGVADFGGGEDVAFAKVETRLKLVTCERHRNFWIARTEREPSHPELRPFVGEDGQCDMLASPVGAQSLGGNTHMGTEIATILKKTRNVCALNFVEPTRIGLSRESAQHLHEALAVAGRKLRVCVDRDFVEHDGWEVVGVGMGGIEGRDFRIDLGVHRAHFLRIGRIWKAASQAVGALRAYWCGADQGADRYEPRGSR